MNIEAKQHLQITYRDIWQSFANINYVCIFFCENLRMTNRIKTCTFNNYNREFTSEKQKYLRKFNLLVTERHTSQRHTQNTQ